ncbi:hypothetical protein B1R32_11344 [Abditibacterium utsteinense]|uniref:Curli production assembly/transport component CsgG n=1 Tax=Abditibacterium utsteinense TaxID=1960156 RepID=A0A2S8SR97_9BACT|nr:hypothetical protein [Abditibacterium utsteinense]PQV63317.1 hypothetical protein B1R32_11344 [Abditibacterium utsteinense]
MNRFYRPWSLVWSSILLSCPIALAVPEAAFSIAPPVLSPPVLSPPLFSEAERARSIAFWNAPGRYEIGPRDGANRGGVWVVRLTPEASIWFNAYNRFQKPEKLPPIKNEANVSPQTRPWETWVAAKLKFDRALAAQQAKTANAELLAPRALPKINVAPNSEFEAPNFRATLPDLPTPTPELAPEAVPTQAPTIAPLVELPPHPGPIPLDLLAAIGNAPPFAACVAPLRHTVRFESGETLAYTDYIPTSNPRNPSFRFAQGVISVGTALSKMAPEELEHVFAASDLSPGEARVMRAVSLLEGGFDSINTYDTGFVSVGFIQFAALQGGSGSLGALLQLEKNLSPVDFARDFHDFGIDVNSSGVLIVLDPNSGAELSGNAAARKIIDDKRLIAVFQLAGKRSVAFRAAQIHLAKTNYYPADSPVSVTINGQILSGLVRDVVSSEAGMATLFDRKVNVGNVRLINSVLQKIMVKRGLSQLEEVAPFERELISALKWRRDFLKDATLSQPA